MITARRTYVRTCVVYWEAYLGESRYILARLPAISAQTTEVKYLIRTLLKASIVALLLVTFPTASTKVTSPRRSGGCSLSTPGANLT